MTAGAGAGAKEMWDRVDETDREQPLWLRRQAVRGSAADYRCFECRADIARGAPYECVTAMWSQAEGVRTMRICAACANVRQLIYADGGVSFGWLKSDYDALLGEITPRCLVRMLREASEAGAVRLRQWWLEMV